MGMLGKMTGKWAVRPSPGPHKKRECLPLMLILRNRLKYALTRRDVQKICMNRLVKVDHRIRTDMRFPAGFMDVITLDRTNENFRLLYDTKGRFIIHRVTPEESKYKLCRVKTYAVGKKAVPYIVTHDGRTIRYPDPSIKANDTVQGPSRRTR